MDNISENTKKILYVFPYWNTFIKDDFTIIEDQAYPLRFGNRHNILIPFYLLRQLILILLRLRTTTRILIQFGGYHSLIPVLLGYLFRKEIYIIVHGTDACSFKEINYGILRKKLLRAFCALSYRYCTKILPVSQSLIHTQNTYFKKEETYTFGLLHEFPTLDKHKFVVVHNGLKTEKWAFHKRAPNKTFISVAGGQSLGHLRKGIDLIINNAQH
ncbi:MAG TPA: hypothetical protein VL947_12250, partial [Cytophagales bacterium]|nr:hypothetical protein [Cytophagales bacterium]